MARKKYYGGRTCADCGCDISHLPDNYSYCEDCYSPSSSGYDGPKATYSQVGLLLKLRDEGLVDDDIYFKGLSVGEASDLIDKALRKKRRR